MITEIRLRTVSWSLILTVFNEVRHLGNAGSIG